MAIGICRGKQLGSVFDNTNVASWVHCEEFGPVDFIDKMGVYDVVPRSAAAEKYAVAFAPDGSQSISDPMTLLSYVPGGLPRSSVVVAVTNTSSSQRHLT